MKFNWLPYLIVTLLVMSCKKPEEHKNWTEVHVSASNFITNEPLTDIYIGIFERKQKALFESELTLLSEGFTNTEGEFYFGWKANNNSKYSYEYVAQADPGRYYKIDFPQFDYLNKGEQHYFNVSLVPYGLLRFNYKNLNCYDENDEMFVEYINCIEVPENNITPNPDLFTYYGCAVDIVTSYNAEPMGTYVYSYYVKRNNSTTYYMDTVIVEAGQETELKIHY